MQGKYWQITWFMLSHCSRQELHSIARLLVMTCWASSIHSQGAVVVNEENQTFQTQLTLLRFQNLSFKRGFLLKKIRRFLRSYIIVLGEKRNSQMYNVSQILAPLSIIDRISRQNNILFTNTVLVPCLRLKKCILSLSCQVSVYKKSF